MVISPVSILPVVALIFLGVIVVLVWANAKRSRNDAQAVPPRRAEDLAQVPAKNSPEQSSRQPEREAAWAKAAESQKLALERRHTCQLCEDNSRTSLTILPDGIDIFIPILDPERVYELTFEGTCMYMHQVIRMNPGHPGLFDDRHADALYHIDHLGNFSDQHKWLTLDRTPLKSFLDDTIDAVIAKEDRELHRYSFRMSGGGKKIAVRFSTPWSRDSRIPWREPVGAFVLTIEVLPKGTVSPLVAKESAALNGKVDEARAALQSKLAKLQCRAHRESNFMDEEFQRRYAQHHGERVLSKLQAEWGREYDELMSQPQFQQLAKEEAPQVLQWLEGRVNIVRLAEQMSAPVPPPPPERKKRTAEQVRALKVHWDEIQAKDRIARAKLKAEMLLKAAAELESIPLDPEEKESLKTELVQKILDIGEQEGNHGNNGTTL
jgi:hypothetical protein